uniref:Uncharacterized protein n=1 Tax=Sphaerodactylus townsendi TaxID=933632 RepID=A0ACB8EQD9_9SAUR
MVLHLQNEAEVKPYEKMSLEQLKEIEDDFDEEDMKALEKSGPESPGPAIAAPEGNCPKALPWGLQARDGTWTCCGMCMFPGWASEAGVVGKELGKEDQTQFASHPHEAIGSETSPGWVSLIKGKYLGIMECGGTKLTVEELEWKLADVGALKTDLEEKAPKGFCEYEDFFN